MILPPAAHPGPGGELIASWQPRTLAEPVAAFVRHTVSLAAPATAARANTLLFALGSLAAFATSVGLELRPEVVLHPSVVERFIVATAASMSGSARRTIRTNLRFLARRALPGSPPAPTPLPRERAKPPYTAGEIAAFLALADAQPTRARRHRAGALICLGAGAGLTGADLRGLRGVDVTARLGGVVVCVVGRRPRTVPVLAPYHDRLLAAATFASEGYLVGGSAAGRKNVTTPLVASLAGGADLARLDLARLRSTWLIAAAGHLGLATFLHAAGIASSQRLGDLVATLPVGTDAEAIALLGGAC